MATTNKGDWLTKLWAVLRIVSTVGFVAVAIFFVVLWIRSYQYVEGGMISTLPSQHIAFHGGSGRMCVWFEHSAAKKWFDWNTRSFLEGEKESADPEQRMPVFDLAPFWPAMTRLYIAHWLLVVVACLFAIAPWCPRKFTLKGILIALTIVCVVAAMISWIDANLT